jgi:hypothetical protein
MGKGVECFLTTCRLIPHQTEITVEACKAIYSNLGLPECGTLPDNPIYSARMGQKFHAQCDGKGPTLTLGWVQGIDRSTMVDYYSHQPYVVVGNNNGPELVGGYASASWVSNGGYTNDPRAFIFSIDRNNTFTKAAVQHARNAVRFR